MTSGSLLREARRRAGLSQDQLARRAGTTQSAIARIEAGGSTPTLERLLRLIRACGLDLDVRLVPADEHETSIVVGNLAIDPAERVEKMLAAQRLGRASG